MTSAMLTERTNFAAVNVSKNAAPFSPASAFPNVCVVPRCKIECEECTDGCKIYCSCDEQVACHTLQNLCRALAGESCCVCCTWNGVTLCQCNFTCCHCRCECTKDGVCISCCSGDKSCCKMIKAL